MLWIVVAALALTAVIAVIGFLIHTKRQSANDLKHAPFVVHVDLENPTDYPAKSYEQALALQHVFQAAHGPNVAVTIRERASGSARPEAG